MACAERYAASPSEDDGTDVRFFCATPIFSVADLQASLRHYEHALGFEVAWQWGEPATFAAVRSGNVDVFFCEGCQGQSGTHIMVFVDDVDTLHDEYRRRGAKITRPPTDEPWGMREMWVEDLDGHVLRLGQGTSN